MKSNTILISGVTGFVGLSLKPYLKTKDYEVIGISRKDNQNSNNITYKGLLKERWNDSTAFIHLAGKVHDVKDITDSSEYYKINTDFTIQLFNQFIKSKCKIFVFMSTVKAVADKIDEELTENHIPNPTTAYGKSKLKAENYILSKELPEGKKVYILRPCMIHGPKNKGNLNLLFNLINKKIPYPLGKFNNKRSFLSINNLCFLIEKLLEKQPESGIYNLADDGSISTNGLVDTIRKTIDKKTKILHIPKWIIKFIAYIGDFLRLPINTEKLQKLTENYCVSNIKLKRAIEEELPLNIKEGLIQTIIALKND